MRTQWRGGSGSLLLLGAVLAVSGCGSGSRDDGRGSGGRDGGIMLMDGGSTGDGGGSMGDGGGSMGDGGGSGGMCRTDMVPAWTMPPPCTDQLIPCLQACPMGDAGTTCQNNCFEMQPRECNICLNATIIKCFNEAGCQGQWDCFATCLEDNCSDAMGNIDTACVDAMCEMQRTDYTACGDRLPMMTQQNCFRAAFQTCVPAPSGGGGSGGGGSGGGG